jgi:hypothetical protein
MEALDLRLFIRQALLDIIGGVSDAQKEAPPGSIAPSDVSRSFTSVQHNVSHLQPVSFELQVVADSSASTGARIGVLGAIVGAAAHGDSKDASQVHSTLKFSVPIHLPGGGKSWAAEDH